MLEMLWLVLVYPLSVVRSHGDVNSLAEVAAGSGAVVGLSMFTVYRAGRKWVKGKSDEKVNDD
jgi:hypothetical protein